MSLLKKIFRKKVTRIQVSKNFFVTNFWYSKDYTKLWFYQFLSYRGLLNKNINFNFISVFGDKPTFDKEEINIFFCGENTALNGFKKFKSHWVNEVDISLGFNEINATNYLRFPLWILYIIPANAELEDIKKIFNNYNSANQNYRAFEYSLIASHDKNGIRKSILKSLKGKKVICAGKFNNNTNILKEKYEDNKTEFLKEVKFNICPENSNTKGYVTEKVFEAISCGCIPIYWGAENNPEPDILNKDCIIFFDNKNKSQLIKDIESMNYKNNSPIKENAAELVWELLNSFEKMIEKKVKEKSKL